MNDHFHLIGNPSYDTQIFRGNAASTLKNWQTWRKPRGCKMVYIIAVGGGSSGGCGLNSGTTSGGGAGGGSGAQTTVLIPAMAIPDELFIQAGQGGKQPSTLVSAARGVAGVITYVSLEPVSSVAGGVCLAFASAGAITGTAATTTVGGVAGTAAAIATKENMLWATRGIYNFFVGQAGAAGGASTAVGANVTLPTTGLMVTGGAGGGGHNSTTSTFAGGNVTGVGLPQYYPTVTGGIAGTGAVAGGQGDPGLQSLWKILTGGAGGGGAGLAAGLQAGGGGDGAPGCGGGGAGGSDTTRNTLARPGNGGDGFVIIVAW